MSYEIIGISEVDFPLLEKIAKCNAIGNEKDLLKDTPGLSERKN